MSNAVFGKSMENTRNHRDIKLVTAEKRRNYSVSELNYCTKCFFSFWKSISNRNEKNAEIYE